jgi:hypothetical protein
VAVGIGIVVVIAIVVAVAYFAYQAHQRRMAALAQLALQLGLRYTAHDPGNVLAMPFTLFDRGDGRSVKDFLTGTREGCPLQLFDYEYYDETTSTNAQGSSSTSRSYSHFTCGLLTLPMAGPHLAIGRENLLTRLGSHLGIHDVELESQEFNQEFRVHCDDQRFAFSLIDARMMEWLLEAAKSAAAIELFGPFVLFAVRRVPPDEWFSLVEFLSHFHEHVPAVVYTTYPPR